MSCLIFENTNICDSPPKTPKISSQLTVIDALKLNCEWQTQNKQPKVVTFHSIIIQWLKFMSE